MICKAQHGKPVVARLSGLSTEVMHRVIHRNWGQGKESSDAVYGILALQRMPWHGRMVACVAGVPDIFWQGHLQKNKVLSLAFQAKFLGYIA